MQCRIRRNGDARIHWSPACLHDNFKVRRSIFNCFSTFSSSFHLNHSNLTDRDMEPSTLETRAKMENFYVRLQIFNKAYCDWWERQFPGALVSLSSTVIVGLFVGLRHTELPWYLYWVYPITGTVLLIQIFVFAYCVIGVQQESEEIVEKLQSLASGSLDGLTLVEKKKVLKRSRAMTPLPFGIHGFTDFSWAVPLAAWDEILNQLFFLLSL